MFAQLLLMGALLTPAQAVNDQTSERMQLRMVADEAEAVLAALDKRAAGKQISDSDWQKVFDSEGYRRLKKREESMQRRFEDAAFKSFVLSPELLSRSAVLRQTLGKWKQ